MGINGFSIIMALVSAIIFPLLIKRFWLAWLIAILFVISFIKFSLGFHLGEYTESRFWTSIGRVFIISAPICWIVGKIVHLKFYKNEVRSLEKKNE